MFTKIKHICIIYSLIQQIKLLSSPDICNPEINKTSHKES